MLPSPDILNEFSEGRFVLSNLAAKRAKQLQSGAVPLVTVESKHPLTIALAEIAAGKVKAVLPVGPGLAVPEIEVPVINEELRTPEFNVLLPALDELDSSLLLEDYDDQDLDDLEADDMSIADLISDDPGEVEEVVPEENTITLSELKDEESVDDEIEE